MPTENHRHCRDCGQVVPMDGIVVVGNTLKNRCETCETDYLSRIYHQIIKGEILVDTDDAMRALHYAKENDLIYAY